MGDSVLPSVYDAKDQRRLRTPKEHPDRIYPAEKLIAEDRYRADPFLCKRTRLIRDTRGKRRLGPRV